MPEHQGKGAGFLIMNSIRNYLKQNAPEQSFVGLFASRGKEEFYESFGIQRREAMTGMFGVIHQGEIV
ncbi:GNAT family N-acetyltransferase [Paenibacillus sp. sgz500958]|uniref:GNAT family N-acetyltransferase n=1 Tax=Paenibacillus sp. sgz500958 TaxID=3242475 RepID=UPI0036D41B1C